VDTENGRTRIAHVAVSCRGNQSSWQPIFTSGPKQMPTSTIFVRFMNCTVVKMSMECHFREQTRISCGEHFLFWKDRGSVPFSKGIRPTRMVSSSSVSTVARVRIRMVFSNRVLYNYIHNQSDCLLLLKNVFIKK